MLSTFKKKNLDNKYLIRRNSFKLFQNGYGKKDTVER